MLQHATKICEPNMGPQEQKQRTLIGLSLVLATFAVLVLVLWITANRWPRLILFPFYLATVLCFFEVRERTCVLLAWQGKTKHGRKVELVADESRLMQFRRQMLRVNRQSLITAALLTAITLML